MKRPMLSLSLAMSAGSTSDFSRRRCRPERRKFGALLFGGLGPRAHDRGRSSPVVSTKIQFELVLVNAYALFGAIDDIAEMQDLEIGFTERLPSLGILQLA